MKGSAEGARKAELVLEYTFLVALGIITVLVIVGLITKWSFNADRVVCKLRGDCDKGELIVNREVSVSDCSRSASEVVKHIEICHAERSNEQSDGLCFLLKMPQGGCAVSEADIVRAAASKGITAKVLVSGQQQKLVLSFKDGAVQVS